MAMTNDPLDRFHCAVCGQAYVVPSLAQECADKDREKRP